MQSVGQKGGGAVLLGEGTYDLDRPVTVRHDGVVIRGRGPDKTKLIFRYALPAGRHRVLRPEGRRDASGRRRPIALHCRPAGLETMTIEVDGKVIHEWERGQHSGNTFATSVSGRSARRESCPTASTCSAARRPTTRASRSARRLQVVVDSKSKDAGGSTDCRAAILFAGKGDGRRRR